MHMQLWGWIKSLARFFTMSLHPGPARSGLLIGPILAPTPCRPFVSSSLPIIGRHPFSVSIPLCASTGPVLGRCCQHQTSNGPVLAFVNDDYNCFSLNRSCITVLLFIQTYSHLYYKTGSLSVGVYVHKLLQDHWLDSLHFFMTLGKRSSQRSSSLGSVGYIKTQFYPTY